MPYRLLSLSHLNSIGGVTFRRLAVQSRDTQTTTPDE